MEFWKTLRDFPGYEGSNKGNIRNVKTQRVLKPCTDKTGRPSVTLRKNGKQRSAKVHKVIAETFLSERPGMDIRHKDNNLSNNRADNLEWVTRSETIKNAYSRGTKRPYQSRRVRVVETGKIYDSILECAADTGCDRSEISKCLAGKRERFKCLHFVAE